MGHFRKKPIVIEAYQIAKPDNDEATARTPKWIVDGIVAGVLRTHTDGHVDVDTLEGTMRGEVGDWIIQGVKGELYPCKADIFAATYEPVVAEFVPVKS